VARVFATLDLMTRGRCAWNVVTSLNNSEALNFGREEHLEHDLRYDRADEFMQVVMGHWGTWEDDALIVDKEKDRFADPAFTTRQRAYAEAQGSSMVYTPQMIVAGAIDVVGSDRKAVEKALKTAYTRNAMYRIQVGRDPKGRVIAQFPEAPIGVPATVWLVTYQKSAESHVKAGENSGRDLMTYNVVRSLQKVGMWYGPATEVELKLDPQAKANSPDACAIIANQAEHGPIIAAAALKLSM